jgi:hypothetical protein
MEYFTIFEKKWELLRRLSLGASVKKQENGQHYKISIKKLEINYWP